MACMKFDMKMLVNIARVYIDQLFTQSARQGYPCTLDTFLVFKLCIGYEGGIANGLISFRNNRVMTLDLCKKCVF